jgi:hypothetical protein
MQQKGRSLTSQPRESEGGGSTSLEEKSRKGDDGSINEVGGRIQDI